MFTRIAGILVVIVTFWNLSWIISVYNYHHPFISFLFLLAFGMTSLYNIVSVINNWNFEFPHLYTVNIGTEPTVAVLIPTYGEPVEMILNTLQSVMNQH